MMVVVLVVVTFVNIVKYSYGVMTNNRVVYKDGFYYEELSTEMITRITGKSFPTQFSSEFETVDYSDLRYVRVKYYDFNGNLHEDGEFIVNKLVSLDVVKIFYELYLNKYPINSIKLVDDYGGNDELSMEDNNSSGFNYRVVENINRLSWHAFGLAIDINPLYNPYVLSEKIYPSTALDYVDRDKDFEGKIDYDDLAYKVFTKYGWKWGGDFNYTKDYQHFYKEVLEDVIRDKKE